MTGRSQPKHQGRRQSLTWRLAVFGALVCNRTDEHQTHVYAASSQPQDAGHDTEARQDQQ